jgi:hypothetical protein
MLLSGSTIGGLITFAVSGLEGKVLMTEGSLPGVKLFGMPYRGFSNASCWAEELGAYGWVQSLEIFTKPFSSM